MRENLGPVREALAGRTYIAPRAAGAVLEALRKGGGAGTPRLTSRQTEVLQPVAEGKSAKEVAAILNLSPRTVASRKYAIMDQLGVSTTAELVQQAMKLGLIRPRSQPWGRAPAIRVRFWSVFDLTAESS